MFLTYFGTISKIKFYGTMNLNRIFIFIIIFQLLTYLFVLQGCLFLPAAFKPDPISLIQTHQDEIGQSKQVLFVRDESFLFFTKSNLYALEKQGDMWQPAFEPFSAVIGRNGFAPRNEKREGDGRTPSGIYPLKIAFGYPESVNTKLPYRQALSDDVWVDDPEADDYNRWTKSSRTRAVSFETMKREDELYKYGIVIEYNTNPVVKGAGSAIFLHLWKCEGIPTAGCVAVSEENMLKILQWLNPEKSPVIITGIEK